jgi:hypothetical protein
MTNLLNHVVGASRTELGPDGRATDEHFREANGCRVGDPDLTPSSGRMCGALHGHQLTCTRRPGHRMPHVAGGGQVILAVWSS